MDAVRFVAVEIHQIGPFVRLLSDFVWCFQPFVAEVACYCEATVWGMIFGCCQLFVVGSASWCFHQTYWLLGFVRVFGCECPSLRSIRFWFLRWISCSPSVGCSASMLSILRWDMSDGERAMARTIRVLLTRVNGWWCRCLFLNHRRWYWYYSLFVTIVWFLGSLMAQGSVLWRCCKNRKPRLDFSSRCLTSLRLAYGRISIVEYVG